MTIGVYPGRFQPFHKGHLAVIEHILEEVDTLYVIICSKKNYTELDDKNPFTFEERNKMIMFSLPPELLDRVEVCHVKDAGNDKEWTDVIDTYIPDNFITYSNNPNTIEAFNDHGFKTKSVPIMKDGINATLIRKQLIRRLDWEGMVPVGTQKIIKGIIEE